MSDIGTELRERSLRAEQDGEPIPLLDEAADEIGRLRQFGRLTRGERQALEFAIGVYPIDDSVPETLRGLLERLGGER